MKIKGAPPAEPASSLLLTSCGVSEGSRGHLTLSLQRLLICPPGQIPPALQACMKIPTERAMNFLPFSL